jgi:hypothetical protein
LTLRSGFEPIEKEFEEKLLFQIRAMNLSKLFFLMVFPLVISMKRTHAFQSLIMGECRPTFQKLCSRLITFIIAKCFLAVDSLLRGTSWSFIPL